MCQEKSLDNHSNVFIQQKSFKDLLAGKIRFLRTRYTKLRFHHRRTASRNWIAIGNPLSRGNCFTA